MSEDNLYNNNDCIICFDTIEINQPIDFLNCNHTNNYHPKCANAWLNECIKNNQELSCPLCRNKLNLYEVIIYTQPVHHVHITENTLQYNSNNYCMYKRLCCITCVSLTLSVMIFMNIY